MEPKIYFYGFACVLVSIAAILSSILIILPTNKSTLRNSFEPQWKPLNDSTIEPTIEPTTEPRVEPSFEPTFRKEKYSNNI